MTLILQKGKYDAWYLTNLVIHVTPRARQHSKYTIIYQHMLVMPETTTLKKTNL